MEKQMKSLVPGKHSSNPTDKERKFSNGIKKSIISHFSTPVDHIIPKTPKHPVSSTNHRFKETLLNSRHATLIHPPE
ncbi:hypothetical protein LXL04_021228 [Taraxacum kok-saghyz]